MIYADAFVDRDDPDNYYINPTGFSRINNLYWIGHLQGMQLSSEYWVESLATGSETIPIAPVDNSICFLIGIGFNELDSFSELT